MQAFQVYEGGSSALGQATEVVTNDDVLTELRRRGYSVQVVHEPVVHVPVVKPFTKGMAISVAIDLGIERLKIDRTPFHPYRCPRGSCPIPQATWTALVDWCIRVSNGYLKGVYALPAWAQTALHEGTLRGAGLSGGHLYGFGDWLTDNPWFVKSVGDTITNYGEYLTAQNVQAAIKANTEKQLSKDDAIALVAALQAGGYVPAGKAQTVAQGATMSAQPSWLMPAIVIGGILFFVVMVMKK